MGVIQVGRETFKGPDQLLAKARALLTRGGPFRVDESALFGAAWKFVHDAPLKTYGDFLLARAARANAVMQPPPKAPRRATPLDAQIVEAETEVAELQARRVELEQEFFRAADDKAKKAGGIVWSAIGTADAVGPRMQATERQINAAIARARDAEDAWRTAAKAESRARGRLNNLRHAADRWRYSHPEEE